MTQGRVAVVGCGSIGSRHARNLRALGVERLALVDLDTARAERLAVELGGAEVAADLAGLGVAPLGAALVCTPPTSHLGVAAQAIALGAHVFCEKPLAADLAGVDALVEQVAHADRIFMMGMCYRFHPGLRALADRVRAGAVGRVLGGHVWVGQWLPDWHPQADYRSEYSARRALGGGVLLDCIHALDTVRWLFGDPIEVTGMLGRVSALEIDTEDVAAAICRLADGVLIEVHADYLQRHPANRIEVVGSDGTMAWDFPHGRLRWRRTGEECWREERLVVDPNTMYLAELREFLAAVATGRRVEADVREGRRTLALAVAVREAAASGRHVRMAGTVAPHAAAGWAA
ncbi:MAG: Gfo/Idh/MocA family oxidoreductase [Candidatus Binatia bacterium]